MIRKFLNGKLCNWLIMGYVAAMAMSATADTVKVTKFHQSYPYSGKATIEYTVVGELPANASAEIILATDDASATFTNENIVVGANKHEIDFASFFCGALVLTNASFVVTITTKKPDGVQLWENGPYWAECNVGATKPEECGYYFWWSDTVGYTRSGGILDDYVYSEVTWVSSKNERMDNSPFTSLSSKTHFKSKESLLSDGYIDSTGNLALAYDAARVHLGSPWRMPTSAEIDSLVSKCTTTWTTRNGVFGRLVTGKGNYADRSIFLPAVGYGSDSSLYSFGTGGFYWSSTPDSLDWDDAWYLYVGSGDFFKENNYFARYHGMSVRPVRDFAK